jgi:hypothetical protein
LSRGVQVAGAAWHATMRIMARVFHSGHKTRGGATAGGARGTIAKVASESS